MGRMQVELPGPFDEPVTTPAIPSPEPGQPDSAWLADFGIATLDGIRTTATDPAYTEKQRRFMGAELGRKRRGKKTRTGMSARQLREFASGVR